MIRYATTEGFAPFIGHTYYAPFAADVRGWVWLCRWRDFEDGAGWLNLKASLDWAAARGQKLIPKLYLKSYFTTPPDDPRWRTVPMWAFKLPSGGVAKTYSAEQHQGWVAQLIDPVIMTAVKDLIARIKATFATHKAWGGFAVDEVFWGQFNGKAWASGDEAAWDAATAEYVAALVAQFGAQAHVVVNYADGPQWAVQSPQLAQAVKAAGASVAISDIKLPPASQPVYPLHPWAGQTTLGHIDWMSTTTDRPTAQRYVDQAKALGVDVLSVVTRGGRAGPYWQAHMAAKF